MNCFDFPRPLLQLFWLGGDFVVVAVQPHSVGGGLHAVCEELKSVSVMVRVQEGCGRPTAVGFLLRFLY